MNNLSKIFSVVVILAWLTACSPFLFQTDSQRLEYEADRLLADDRVSEALLAYRQSIDSDPLNFSATRKLIPLYQKQGRLREAYYLFQLIPEADRNALKIEPADLSPGESENVKLDWIQMLNHEEPVGLTADEQAVVVSYRAGNVALVDITNGSILWSISTEKVITSPPSLTSSAVFVGCESGALTALRRSDGKIIWETHLKGAIYASPVAKNGLLYVGSYEGQLAAIDLANGSVRWQADAESPILAPVAVDGETLYVATTAGTVHSLNRNTGEALWIKPARLPGSLEAQPVVVSDRILVATNDSRVYALALNGKDYFWQFSMSDSIYSNPVVDNDRAYIFSIGQSAAAVDLKSGEKLWQVEIPVPVRSTPVLINEQLYFSGISQSNLYVMDTAAGQIKTVINTGDWIAAGPMKSGKHLLLAGKDGALLSYRIN